MITSPARLALAATLAIAAVSGAHANTYFAYNKRGVKLGSGATVSIATVSLPAGTFLVRMTAPVASTGVAMDTVDCGIAVNGSFVTQTYANVGSASGYTVISTLLSQAIVTVSTGTTAAVSIQCRNGMVPTGVTINTPNNWSSLLAWSIKVGS